MTSTRRSGREIPFSPQSGEKVSPKATDEGRRRRGGLATHGARTFRSPAQPLIRPLRGHLLPAKRGEGIFTASSENRSRIPPALASRSSRRAPCTPAPAPSAAYARRDAGGSPPPRPA